MVPLCVAPCDAWLPYVVLQSTRVYGTPLCDTHMCDTLLPWCPVFGTSLPGTLCMAPHYLVSLCLVPSTYSHLRVPRWVQREPRDASLAQMRGPGRPTPSHHMDQGQRHGTHARDVEGNSGMLGAAWTSPGRHGRMGGNMGMSGAAWACRGRHGLFIVSMELSGVARPCRSSTEL